MGGVDKHLLVIYLLLVSPFFKSEISHVRVFYSKSRFVTIVLCVQDVGRVPEHPWSAGSEVEAPHCFEQRLWVQHGRQPWQVRLEPDGGRQWVFSVLVCGVWLLWLLLFFRVLWTLRLPPGSCLLLLWPVGSTRQSGCCQRAHAPLVTLLKCYMFIIISFFSWGCKWPGFITRKCWGG